MLSRLKKMITIGRSSGQLATQRLDAVAAGATIGLPLLLACGLVSCGGGTTSKSVPIPAQRNGRSVISISKQFTDLAPAISADGAKITFVSGRTGTDRIFKSEYTADTAPPAPTRVTADDSLTKELNASISNNGNWVLISGVKDGTADLFLSPFSGASATTLKRLSTDKESETSVAFSADSALFAFIKSPTIGAPGRIHIGQVGDGSAVTVQAVGAATDKYSQVFWGPGNYTLYAVGIDGTSGKRILASLTFSDYAGSATAALTTVLADFSANYISENQSVPVISGGNVLFSQRLNQGARTVTEGGTTPKADTTYGVATEIASKALNGSATASWTSVPLTTATIVGISANGADVFTFGREVIRCAAADGPGYIGGLSIIAADGTNMTRVIPRTAPTAGSFEITSDPCAKTHPDNSVSKLDFSIIGAVFSQQSTRDAFRAAVVTLGNTSAGDPEVVLIEKKSDGSFKYFGLSQNPKI